MKIKTTLVKIEIEDEPKIGDNNFTKRAVPELTICIKSAVDEAIRLHQETYKSNPS